MHHFETQNIHLQSISIASLWSNAPLGANDQQWSRCRLFSVKCRNLIWVLITTMWNALLLLFEVSTVVYHIRSPAAIIHGDITAQLHMFVTFVRHEELPKGIF
ncbi:hypothetical protein CDAR_4111 [Caerostris darwini]|uniref:Uncharacterized protein n=1 Tax=Caerostris darwini TaxID=1538125 RepID=A0AAV4WY70_9ARAC|nr:hypothetical protein CDAR_4111 [Caerostris darwini]